MMAGVYTEDYVAFTAFICRSPSMPAGIKYPDTVSMKGISVSSGTGASLSMNAAGTDLSSQDFFDPLTKITEYLYKDEYFEYPADVYVLFGGDGPEYLLSAQPNAVDGSGKDSSWERLVDRIYVDMPELLQCGVDGIKIIYSPGQFTEADVPHKGTIISDDPEYTFNKDGYFPIDVSLLTTQLIPGMMIYVFYRLNGLADVYLLGTFSFQTNIFTSAEVTGCALCDRVKVYNNPYNVDDGYVYVYQPVAGGEGFELKPEWLYDTRLRWCVSYYGEKYWLRSVFPCQNVVGQRAAVLKSAADLPAEPDTAVTDDMVRRTLSETSDMLAPDHFYTGITI